MEPKDVVKTDNFKMFQNTKCEFFPCHNNVRKDFNCLFCHCPLYFLECPGPYGLYKSRRGDYRKDCVKCNLPHEGKAGWNFVNKWLENPVTWIPPENNA